jgi:hypothetical protein
MKESLATSQLSPGSSLQRVSVRPFTSICYECVTSQHLPNMVMLQLCVVLMDSLLRTLSMIIHKYDETSASNGQTRDDEEHKYI